MLARRGALSTPSTVVRRRLAVLLATALAVVALDHLTKWLVVSNIGYGEELWPSAVLSIDHVHNTGAAFGLFPQFQWFYLVVAIVVAGYILVVAPRMEGGMYRQVVLGAILGGAVSNAIDRLLQGYVVDFLDLHHWPVFNVADICIVGGILVAVVTFGIVHDDRRAAPPGDGA